MAAASSSKDSAPPIPPGTPPAQPQGLVLTQVPSPKGPATFEDGVDWDEEDPAGGDPCSGTESLGQEDMKEWRQLRETFKTGLETAKFSKTRAAHPGDLDMECIAAAQAEKDEALCNVGMRIARSLHHMPKSSTPKSVARQQWTLVLSQVVNAAPFHFDKADELNIGLSNDSEDSELSRTVSYTHLTLPTKRIV